MVLLDAFIVIGIFVGIGYIIFAKINKNNPSAAMKIKEFMSGGMYKPPIPPIPMGMEEATMM